MQTQIINKSPLDEKKWSRLIIFISIFVVAAVAVLIYLGNNVNQVDASKSWIYTLPKINAFLNSGVAILLICSFISIRNKNIALHRALNLTAFGMSSLFLVFYIVYHGLAPDTKYGDLDHNSIVDASELLKVAGTRTFYFILLISHIALASIIVPMCLFTLFRAFTKNFEKHKKIARWTFPFWLYVSITGVVVYLMIQPYYPF